MMVAIVWTAVIFIGGLVVFAWFSAAWDEQFRSEQNQDDWDA